MADKRDQLSNDTRSILCVIPARGRSKSVPRKNLQLLAHKPLIAYAIAQALESRFITRTIVSTEDPEIAEVARNYGAEVPFSRPAEFAADDSTDLEVFQHALAWLLENEAYVPDICVHLRPTHPIRKVGDIDRVIDILRGHPEIDSVRSVVPARDTPFKMWFRKNDGLLTPVVQTAIAEAYNQPRQTLPQVFLQNAAIDAVWTRVITETKSMTGNKTYGYVMAENFDIDTETDLNKAREYMLEQPVKG
jgi:CMP-N,N'-diacetyllegionaminic acid synthase